MMTALNIGEPKQMFPTTKAAVLSFVNVVLTTLSQTFTGEELRHFVETRAEFGMSPTSVDRALRQLRQEGKLDYTVENRGRSLYKARPIGYTTPPAPKKSDAEETLRWLEQHSSDLNTIRKNAGY